MLVLWIILKFWNWIFLEKPSKIPARTWKSKRNIVKSTYTNKLITLEINEESTGNQSTHIKNAIEGNIFVQSNARAFVTLDIDYAYACTLTYA